MSARELRAMLKIAEAHQFLRAHFDIDVNDDDVLIAQYMLAQLAHENLKPEFREMGADIAMGIVRNSNGILEKSHASMVDAAEHIGKMREAMNVTIQAAEKAERLNAMLDEKIAALDERLAQSDEIAKEATKAARTCNQAVVALTSGLLKVRSRSFWKRD